MSIEITSAEISDELEDQFSKAIKYYQVKDAAAAWLNLAIKAGLVSPPVWVIRHTNDLLQTDHDDKSLYLSQTNTNILPQNYRYEHWKGQTE